MAIDLTKPIIVEMAQEGQFWVPDIDDYPGQEEAYRQLFEEAPRTKLEHGKMLAMLKRLVNPAFGDKESEQFEAFKEMLALIAEMEGVAK